MSERWTTHTLGRCLFDAAGDNVATFDTPELAQRVARALNAETPAAVRLHELERLLEAADALIAKLRCAACGEPIGPVSTGGGAISLARRALPPQDAYGDVLHGRCWEEWLACDECGRPTEEQEGPDVVVRQGQRFHAACWRVVCDRTGAE